MPRNLKPYTRAKITVGRGGLLRASSGKHITSPGWESDARDGDLSLGEPADPGEFTILNPQSDLISTGTEYLDQGDGALKLGDDGAYTVVEAGEVLDALLGPTPAPVVDDNLTGWDGVTGRLVKDSGIPTVDVVLGDTPGPAGEVAEYVDTAGRLIKGSGIQASDIANRAGGFTLPINAITGGWVPATYQPGDMVLDDGWLGVAKVVTTDKLAPVPDGAPAYLLPDPIGGATPNLAGVVYTGQEYTFTDLVFVDAIRAWLPETTDVSYNLVAQNITNPANIIMIGSAELPPPAVPGWVGVSMAAVLFGPGEKLRLMLISEKTVGETSFTRPWGYDGTGVDVDPGTGDYARNALSTELYISTTDDNVADASADLATLADGDRIELVEVGTAARYENYRLNGPPVNNGTYYMFPVAVTGLGSAIRANNRVNISGYAAGGDPTIYSVITDHWLTNPVPNVTIKGFLSQDPDVLPLDDSAYGTDVRGNSFSTSPDWELYASSSGGGSGGSGQAASAGRVSAGSVEFAGAYAISVPDSHAVALVDTWEEFVPGVAVITQLAGLSHNAGRLQLDVQGGGRLSGLVVNVSIRIPMQSQEVAVGFGVNGAPGASIEFIKAVAGSGTNPTADVTHNLVVTVPLPLVVLPGDAVSIFLKSSIANILAIESAALYVVGQT